MKELVSMWKYPKMVALTALSAALYAAVLIPFKSFQIMPGIEVRVGTAIIPALGIFFGPAGAWGAAIGNIIGDFFGSIGIGSIFGFLGNFFFAFASYKIWYSGDDNFPLITTSAKVGKYVVASLFGTGSLIAWLCFGLALIGSLPYKVLPPTLIMTNGIPPLVLGPFLISLFSKRLTRWNLTFTTVMQADDFKIKGSTNIIGVILIVVGVLGSISVGEYMSLVLGIDVGSRLLVPVGIFLIVYLVGLFLVGVNPKDFDEEEEED